MNIQTVTEKTGLSKRMIRHYEELGLLTPTRSENNYRDYKEEDIDRLLCVKALRSIGFGLEDIGQILKEEQTEVVFKRHLEDLLLQRQEAFLEQKRQVQSIKKILKSQSKSVHDLLDQIAEVHNPRTQKEETLEAFFERRRVVHGHIKDIAEFAKIVRLGFNQDFSLQETEFNTFAAAFAENTFNKASLCSCEQVFTHFILLSENREKYNEAFHRKVWSQFAKTWMQVSSLLSLTFEAVTSDIVALEGLFSSFDIAICMKFENHQKESFDIIIPGQPLIAHLKTLTEMKTKIG